MAKKKSSHAELVSASQIIDAPYELPEGWKWIQQNEVCRLTDGEKISDVEYPYLEVKYLRGNKDKEIITSGKFVKTGTKVILVDGENSGEVFTVPEDGYMGSTFKSLSIQNVDENYLQFFIATKKDFYRNNKKGSAIPHLDKKLFFTMPFPLPPTIEEQQRIVNRIESMFAKLDEAKEKAQNVVDSFETRKAAILHQAFTGNLTAKWRKENGVLDDSWEEKNLEEISIKITDGEHITPKRVDSYCGYYLLSARNILNGSIKLDDVDYVGKEEFDRIRRRCNPEKNDILISCSGSVGRVCVIQDDNQYVMVRSAAMVKIKDNNPFFVAYMLQSHSVQQQIEKTKKQSCQANLFLGAIKELYIPIPGILEQQEIVCILDTVLEKERTAKSTAEQVLEQIDLLKKSILARAFRGEL